MSNHIHLLLQTGKTPISRFMQSILTGYANNFNYRYNRTGKLYQNRFKSILCEKDEYFLKLIQYINLNPLKAGVLKDISELDKSLLTGHAILMGNEKAEWLQKEEILCRFGKTEKEARTEYRKYIEAGLDLDYDDFEGGGFVRSAGGLWEALKDIKSGEKETADERILGSGEFVKTVLEHAEEQESRKSQLQEEGWDFAKVLSIAAETVGLHPEELLRKGRGNARSEGRALLSKWLVDDIGETQISVANELGIKGPSVSVLTVKGRELEKSKGISFPGNR
jgi:hypothetical protein